MSDEQADDEGKWGTGAGPSAPEVEALLTAAGTYVRFGQLDAAADVLDQVLEAAPEHLDALYLAGKVAYRRNAFERAVECLQAALRIGPPIPEALFGLAAALERLERLEEAAAAYQGALRLKPDFPEALANLGGVLRRMGRANEGIDCLREAVRQLPNQPAALCNLGVVLFEAGRLDEAADRCAEALRLDPALPEAWTNLGSILQERGRLDEAIACQKKAVCLHPAMANALSNLAGNLMEHGRPDDALACSVWSLRADASCAVGAWNESMARLALGDLETGWDLYERRWGLYGGPVRSMPQRRGFRQPLWDGGDLAGKRLFVWKEQGIGDEIMFGSCIPDLAATNARITLECSPKLQALFARSFPHVTVVTPGRMPDEERDDFDTHLPIGSLPRLYRRSLADFPGSGGFLVPDPQRVAHWRRRLEELGPGPYVGLSWRGLARLQARNHHYSRIEDWEPVLRIPGLTFVNMQYDGATEEVAKARAAFGATIHTFTDIDMWNDLDGVAALVKALDLQLSVLTAVAQIAGAVGAPTRLLLIRNGSWTCLGTERLPWYPSIRVVTHELGQPWRTLTERVAADLSSQGRAGGGA